MRTTVVIDDDVLALAKAIAGNRGVSIGRALSDLARKGAHAAPAMRMKSGFPVITIPPGTPSFGPADIQAALESEDQEYGAYFVGRHERSK